MKVHSQVLKYSFVCVGIRVRLGPALWRTIRSLMVCHGRHVWGAVSSATLRTHSLNHCQHSCMVLNVTTHFMFLYPVQPGLLYSLPASAYFWRNSLHVLACFFSLFLVKKKKSLCTLFIGSTIQMATVRFPAHLTWGLETQWPIGYCWSSTCFLCSEDTVLTVLDFFFLIVY